MQISYLGIGFQSLATTSNTQKISSEQLLDSYAAGELDFPRVNLSNSIMTGVNLSLVNFRGAELNGSVLKRVNLARANLSMADLSGANLTGADLSGANLVWADLHNANLAGADLTGANLTGADLTGANLNGTTMPDGTVLSSSKLSNRSSGKFNLISKFISRLFTNHD
ncbi:MAG: pentapeptide repeat-containing protein [Symploca sp. SIO2C1]|nr:pentapeptide repeat-containing protein [Symploca sp. SIO2C1]